MVIFSARSRKEIKPKWINPCGIDPRTVKQMYQHHAFYFHEVTPLSDQELITNILLSAKNALVHSDDFKEKFVSSKFSFNSVKINHQMTVIGSLK